MDERFERLVDPDGVMTPADRAAAVENARQAHYRRMALRSAQARRARKAAAPAGAAPVAEAEAAPVAEAEAAPVAEAA